MVPLYIILHGLIALVPLNEADGVNHMTALLVDAKQPPEMVECFKPHMPMLTLNVVDKNECTAAGCTLPSTKCICDFNVIPHKQAIVDISPSVDIAKQKLLKDRPQRDLPFGPSDAGGFAYIANLELPPINATFNTDFLSRDPNVPVPAGLIARMTFPFESVNACTLAVRHTEGSDAVHSLGFWPIHGDEQADGLSQALAQQAVASIKIPDGTSVVVTISDFDGSNPKPIRLATEFNSTLNSLEYLVMLENSRQELRPDDQCEDGIGRDFAFFYGLTNNPMPWTQRPIPHIKYNRWKSAGEIEVDACKKHPIHAMTSRPICALASFIPPSE
jgi:hypothetical protein